MKPPPKATLRDVAMAAGVSPMIASRVLSGKTRVAPAKQRAVERAAKDLGYSVNTTVRAVMSEMRRRKATSFSGVLGFLNTSYDREAWHALPYNRAFFEGAQQRASDTGFFMDEIWVGQPGWTPERTGKVLRARGIRGFLIPPGAAEEQFSFDLQGFAMATFGGQAFNLHIHQVLPDHFHNYALCYQELKNLGHRRIGIYIPDYDLRTSGDAVLGGYLSAQWRTPKKDHVPVGCGAVNWQVAEQSFCAWFHRHKPHAVIADYNQVPAWLKKCGVRIPKGVALAHPALGPDVEEWSGVDMRGALQASQAVDLVTSQLLRNERGLPREPQTVIIQGHWVPGKTAESR